MQQPLYQQRAYPVFQNRMYGSADDARNCPKGDILLTQDPATGIVSNRAFQPELQSLFNCPWTSLHRSRPLT